MCPRKYSEYEPAFRQVLDTYVAANGLFRSKADNGRVDVIKCRRIIIGPEGVANISLAVLEKRTALMARVAVSCAEMPIQLLQRIAPCRRLMTSAAPRPSRHIANNQCSYAIRGRKYVVEITPTCQAECRRQHTQIAIRGRRVGRRSC